MNLIPLATLIESQHGDLVHSSNLNTRALLHALADVESGQGAMRLAARHEKGYCYGSTLYTGPNGADLREQSHVYGCLAHSSFGTWQLMFIGAFEMGFRGDPVELRDDAVSLPVVIRFLNQRILSRWPRITVRSFADAYNSGNPNDSILPIAYMDRFEEAYAAWWRKFEAPQVLRG